MCETSKWIDKKTVIKVSLFPCDQISFLNPSIFENDTEVSNSNTSHSNNYTLSRIEYQFLRNGTGNSLNQIQYNKGGLKQI